jgi:formylglycine-generating enzyme required for sulfatase activity/serine/threonine protein kinase
MGQMIDNRYEILEKIGKGSMGGVFLAEDTRLKRKVAIKRLVVTDKQTDMDVFLQRFQREALEMAGFQHPNIVSVYDYGSDEEGVYLVLEHMPGGVLTERIRKGAMAPAEAAAIILPLADALQAIHDRGRVHRDVKPSNIMFDRYDNPKLADFGVVKLVESDGSDGLTVAGTTLGTPAYMAPELVSGQPLAQSDQYALALVCFELVTGRKPFSADSPLDMLYHQRNTPLPAPSSFQSGLPAWLDDLLQKALAKQPAERFADMRSFIEAFQQGLMRDAGSMAEAPAKMAEEEPPTQLDIKNEEKPESSSTPASGFEESATVLAPRDQPAPQVPQPAPIDPPSIDSATVFTPRGEHTPDISTPSAPSTMPQDSSTILVPDRNPLEGYVWGETPPDDQPQPARQPVSYAQPLPTESAKPRAKKRLPLWLIILAGLGAFLLCAGAGLLVSRLFLNPQGEGLSLGLGARTATATLTATLPPSPTATETLLPTATATVEPTPTETPQPTRVPNVVRDVDGMEMVHIPAGEFTMGSTRADNEQPVRQVSLDAYWIDMYEVTNQQYGLCVEAGACTTPAFNYSNTRESYHNNPEYANYPVIYVTWTQAQSYCEWSGGRLPTEAEWEKTARGATDERNYPWGNQTPECNLVNFGGDEGCVADTSEVGAYPDGASPYGVMDMSGNVWEWVADWYDETYYANGPLENPTGPEDGQQRVLRGGSWYKFANAIRVSFREVNVPEGRWNHLGFRCVMDPE